MIDRADLAACFKGAFKREEEGADRDPLRYCPLVVVVLFGLMGLCMIIGLALHSSVPLSKPRLYCTTLDAGLEYCWYSDKPL